MGCDDQLRPPWKAATPLARAWSCELVNKAKHVARLSRGTTFRIGDMLIEDEQGFRGSVRQYALFTHSVDVDIALVSVVGINRTKSSRCAFVSLRDGPIPMEVSDLRRVPPD